MSIEKRKRIPRILEAGELPEFATVESGVEKRDVVADDLSYIFELLQKDTQVAGTTSLSSELYRDRALKNFREVDYVPRKEEDSFLRAPVQGERPCIRDEECEARNIFGPPVPFTLVEHLTAKQKTERPAERQMCIMCKRYAVNSIYIQNCCELTDQSKLFNTHANYANRYGEYALEQCIIASSTDSCGALAACAVHCRAWYEYWVDPVTRIQYFRQSGYRELSDF